MSQGTARILQQLRQIMAASNNSGLGDGELLDQFLERHDEAAFESLVRRHGPMVLRVGRRVLSNAHDAEDVFQATFLTLASRAATIRKRRSVACWLYGVANRIAMKARRDGARRVAASAKSSRRDQPGDPLADLTGRELCGVLDEELSRLPTQCQAALVLCHLEGKTQDEAAAQLGLSLATLKRRLERGRQMLERRLVRRGFTLSAVLAAGTLASGTASATVPIGLIGPTVKAGSLLAAGRVTEGAVSAKVAGMAEGAIHALSWAKFKIAGLIWLFVGMTGSGVAAFFHQAPGADSKVPRVIAPNTAAAKHSEPAPMRSPEKVAQDALAKVEKNWKPFDNRPNLGDHRWMILMTCLADVVKAGPDAIATLEEAAKDGSPWADSTRDFAARAVGIIRGPAETRERIVRYNVAQMDSAHVAQLAPDFSLADATGKKRQLSHFRGEVVILTFIVHDVFCQGYLEHLRDSAMEFDRHNIQLVFVAAETRNPDRAAHLILEDKAHTVSATYGVAFQWPHDTLGLSRPATFVIDAEGIIRFAYLSGTSPTTAFFDRQSREERHWSYDRPSAEKLIRICEGLQKASDSDAQKVRLAKLRGAAVPALIGALNDEDRFVRSDAIQILAERGPEAQEAVAALTACLRDKVGYVRSAAANALGRMGSKAVAAVPALCEALRDPDEGVSRAAAEALGRIGPRAVEAVPALLMASAYDAIGRIGPDSVPVLTDSLSGEPRHVRLGAAKALGRLGPLAKAAVASLVTALKDPDAHVRAAAAEALGRIGLEAYGAMPAVIEAVNDKHWGARRQAIFAIGRIDPKDKRAFPVILAAVSDKETPVRHAATVVLGLMGPTAKAAIPDLQRMLQDKDGYVRLAGATSLWQIDPASKDTLVTTLLDLLASDEAEVRYGAAQMLRMVNPQEAGIKDVR